MIILGGSHDDAADVRARVQDLGGSCAVNLTLTVTDYVALRGAESDLRWARVIERGLTELDPAQLEPVAARSGTSAVAAVEAMETIALPRGGVTDLVTTDVTVTAAWVDQSGVGDIDVVAFVVDASASVGSDEDFCFYNQPTHPSGVVDLDLATADQASMAVTAAQLPADHRIVLAASIDGSGTFGALGPIELSVRSREGAPLVRATLDAAADETSLILAELYWRNGSLRFRAVGQGFKRRLAALAVGYGVDIEETPE
ncbi:TerD family protein [Calidifontibacter terrae]